MSNLFYPIIIILGAITTYTDAKFRVIKNRHLFLAGICGAAVYAYLITTQKIVLNPALLLNPAIGLAIGFLLYYIHVWGAGDAKLFFVYSLLMPTEKYSQLIPFPSLVLFANIFLTSTFVILILSLKQISEHRYSFLKKVFSLNTLYKLAYSFLIVFSISWPISSLTSLFKPYTSAFLMVIILYFSYLFIYQAVKFQKKWIIFIIFGLGLVLRFIIQPQDFGLLYLFSYLKITVSYTLLFYILSAIFELNKSEESKNVIPFAPLMLLGTLAANSNLLYKIMQALNILRK